MKINYHVSTSYEKNKELFELIKSLNIPYADIWGRDFVFDFSSDHPNCPEFLYYLKQDEHSLIIQEAVFSKEEMQNAEWFSLEATRSIVETRNFDYTFELSCEHLYGSDMRFRHREQVNPFVVRGLPNWKSRFNFCSECGDFSIIFCSDYGKDRLINSGIVGIDFLPTLKGDLNTIKEGIHQLMLPNILPT